MFASESVSDFFYDAVSDLAVGVVPEGGEASVWEAFRDLVANLELDGCDIEALYDELEAPEGGAPHVAILVADIYENEAYIGVVPEVSVSDALRADLERCNGQIFDDQSEETDWEGFGAALRLLAACGRGGSYEGFEEAFATSEFGSLLKFGIARGGEFDVTRLQQPLAACYTMVLGAM